MFRRRISPLLALGLLLAGCGDDNPKPAATDPITGGVTVFAATSLGGAFTDLSKKFEAAHAGVTVTFNFAASSALSQQVLDGARADVFASADQAHVTKLGDLVRAPAVFAQNRLVIVTKRGNRAKVASLADLAGAGVVSLCGLEVPCGKYAAEALAKAGVSIPESKVTRGQNVAATLTAVTEGDAVAGIVYVTDARAAAANVTTIAIPDAANVVAAYPIAVLRAAPNNAAARAFVAYVRSRAGQRVLQGYGFLPAK